MSFGFVSPTAGDSALSCCQCIQLKDRKLEFVRLTVKEISILKNYMKRLKNDVASDFKDYPKYQEQAISLCAYVDDESYGPCVRGWKLCDDFSTLNDNINFESYLQKHKEKFCSAYRTLLETSNLLVPLEWSFFIEKLKRCNILDFSAWPDITDDELHFVLFSFCCLGNLYSLKLSGCTKITDAWIKPSDIRLKSSLMQLCLSNCSQITDQMLDGISSHLDLEYLCVFGCTQVTDNGLKAVVARFPFMKDLIFKGCSQITSDGSCALLAAINERQQINGYFNIEPQIQYR